MVYLPKIEAEASPSTTTPHGVPCRGPGGTSGNLWQVRRGELEKVSSSFRNLRWTHGFKIGSTQNYLVTYYLKPNPDVLIKLVTRSVQRR
ncbi:hypothetical protein TRAPUB_7039 [Trametes pubescens]|uniref:Uncharacterized protein n=1 Tax=Trametes pubescens TaxID=154538 RepID=A0A1M2V4E5_TRAPU|nr:hypothetical protein TRAPUB_7039 [Trametes pubescens]